MNLFLSWSGKKSEAAAKAFHKFFNVLFGPLHPEIYLSSDTKKGDYWETKLNQALSNADFGVLFLTGENCANVSAWMMYEAGILSRTAGPGCVMTFLLDVKAEKIPDPVSRMQSTGFRQDEIAALAVRMYHLYQEKHCPADRDTNLTELEISETAKYMYTVLERDLNAIGEPEPGEQSRELAKLEQLLQVSMENQALLKTVLSNQTGVGDAGASRRTTMQE